MKLLDIFQIVLFGLIALFAYFIVVFIFCLAALISLIAVFIG